MTEQQNQNGADAANIQSGETKSDKRERSKIEFPYNDLDEAVVIAKAIHDNAGVSCTLDQLAAYLSQSMTSGAFRLRVSNARIFGLTENERGEVRLTNLGRTIADPSKEAAARVEAFLAVPLYAKVYENYKGYTLPPAAALERFMSEAGVSSKQTGKARQAFMRSAKQAGFLAHGEDRLVRPAGPGTKPITPPAVKDEKRNLETRRGNGGGDDGDGGGSDPLISALIQKLPPTSKEWPADDRVSWLKMMAMAFQMAYGQDGEIEIKKSEAAN